MATYDWGTAKDKIDAAIVKYGTSGDLHPDSGAAIEGVKFIVANYSAEELASGMIQSGWRKVYLSTTGVPTTINNRYRLVINGTPRRIDHVEPVAPADDVIVYVLRVI